MGPDAVFAYHERSQISVPLLHSIVDLLDKLSSLWPSLVWSFESCMAIQIGLVGVSKTACCAGSRAGIGFLRSFITNLVQRYIVVESCSLNIVHVRL